MSSKITKPTGMKPPLNLIPYVGISAVASVFTIDLGTEIPNLAAIPYGVLCATSSALEEGALKYAPWNWLGYNLNDASEYGGAIYRHISQYHSDGWDYAKDSGVHHLAHALAGVLILLTKIGVGFHLPLQRYDFEAEDVCMLQSILLFNDPNYNDFDEEYGLHHLAITGALIVKELDQTGVGYAPSIVARKARAKAGVVQYGTEPLDDSLMSLYKSE